MSEIQVNIYLHYWKCLIGVNRTLEVSLVQVCVILADCKIGRVHIQIESSKGADNCGKRWKMSYGPVIH
jgi:hypothetical protein